MVPMLFAAMAAVLPIDELPFAPQSLIYQSPQEVEKGVAAFEGSVPSALSDFVRFSQAGKYDQAYERWSDLQFTFFTLHLKLNQTADLTAQEQVKGAVSFQKASSNEAFQKALLSYPDLLPTLLSNAEAAVHLTSQQRLFTKQILEEYQKSEQIAAALAKLSTAPQGNFALAQGLAKPLDAASLKQLRIFTANIICFPGSLTYLYGGISPWKGRIDQIVKIISSTQAHIVCLQEVWDPEVMRALIETLKTSYAYFVYDAGDPAGTLQIGKMGYNSGLFIASQLPLDEVNFSRFPRSIPEGSNRGALHAVCRAGKQKVAVMTTHLQHGETSQMVEVRKEQLNRCCALLQEATRPPSSCSWGFVAGDLNVDAFSQEFKTSGLSELFLVPYTDKLSSVKKEKATATNYFSDLVRTPFNSRAKIKVSYELLDYCIQPAKPQAPIQSTQRLIPLFSVEQPGQALSDHHGLLTTWTLP